MVADTSLTDEIIAQAESCEGIRVGIAHLEDVLTGPSYLENPKGPETTLQMDEAHIVDWPSAAQTVLVLGLHHPEQNPRLDWWERGDTAGNRRLRKISELLKHWLRTEHQVNAYPLPYDVEKGGVFLKDAAVLAGMGIIGRSNLFLHPEWGPRIRLRSMLLEGYLPITAALEGFAPCEACDEFCHRACPMDAFPEGTYSRSNCLVQMNNDEANQAPDGDIGENGNRYPVIKYCRACELSCPVGLQ